MPMYSSQKRRKKRKFKETYLRKSLTDSLWNYHMAKTTSTLQHKVDNASVIRQKGEPQNMHAKFSEKNEHFLPSDTQTYECFFETLVLRFALLPNYRRMKVYKLLENFPLQQFKIFFQLISLSPQDQLQQRQ